MLGEHERELEAARRGYERYPDAGALLVLAPLMTAHAALGRVQDLHNLVDGAATGGSDPSLGFAMLSAIRVLNANGYTDAAQGFLERVIDWLEALPPDEAETAGNRQWYGEALILAARYEDAQRVLNAAVKQLAGVFEASLNIRGARAVAAALRGDTAQAREDAEWFEQLDAPFLRGQHTLQRARIAANLGERDRAVQLYRQCFAEGVQYFSWTVYWVPQSLRDYPPFQELMRPKG
jgi:tetratricopeptide (TPR) repeat protein